MSPEEQAALDAADKLALQAYFYGVVAAGLEEPRLAYVKARMALPDVPHWIEYQHRTATTKPEGSPFR